MDLLPDADQESLVDAVADLLSGRAGDDRPTPWSALAEMGVFGLAVPEELGGAGLGRYEQALVFREFGRRLTPGPLLGTVLAAGVLAAASEPPAGGNQVLARLLAGTDRVALAEPFRDRAAVVGEKTGGRFAVLDAEGASWVLAVSRAGAALLPADVLASAPVTATSSLDPSVTVRVVELDAVAAYACAPGPATAWDGCLLTAALLAGIAEQTTADSVRHTSTREQFGVPIGSFQAVKHRCADMTVRAEAASAQVLLAAALDTTRTTQVAIAKVVAADAARANAADNVQNHGGMGFTTEVDAHRHVRRGLLLAQLLGAERVLLDELGGLDSLD